jgi:EmrB/QacA subfamily drug resistance transporter
MTTKAHTSKGIALTLACAAQFMVVLDIAIVNVALPSIQRDLGIGQSTLQWIVIAYGLMLGGFVLLGGRMADLVGRRRMLLTGLTLFSSASLLAGVAGSAGLLIGARAIQGFGAALVAPAALSILAVTFAEGAQRNRALGIYGAVTGISASVGVIASGLITAGPGWRWVFFINIPIGAVLIAMAAIFLAVDARARRSERFDIAGAVTVTGAILLLVYGLNRGSEFGWGTGPTLGLLAAAAVMLFAFVRVEAQSRSPLVPVSSLRNRTLVAANLGAFLTFGAIFSFIFLGSLLMQQVLGYSPTQTGVCWLAMTATSFVAAAVTGARLVAIAGVRRLLVAGFSLLAISALLLTRVPDGAHFATDLLPSLLLAGVGGGIIAPAAQIGALSGVTPSMSGLASGLFETMREIGGAIGVAVVSTVLVLSAGQISSAAIPAASPVTAVSFPFHAAYWVIFAIAALGVVTAGVAFPRRRSEQTEPAAPVRSHDSIGTELTEQPARDAA